MQVAVDQPRAEQHLEDGPESLVGERPAALRAQLGHLDVVAHPGHEVHDHTGLPAQRGDGRGYGDELEGGEVVTEQGEVPRLGVEVELAEHARPDGVRHVGEWGSAQARQASREREDRAEDGDVAADRVGEAGPAEFDGHPGPVAQPGRVDAGDAARPQGLGVKVRQ